MKKIGGIIFIIGLIMMIGFAGTDDAEIMQGMFPSFESLIIKMIFALILTLSGFALMKRGETRGR